MKDYILLFVVVQAIEKCSSANTNLISPALAADNNGVDSSILPNGITTIAQFPTSEFCSQFLGQIQEGDGLQRKVSGQTCSSTPIGLIPSVDKMVQTLIIEPSDGAILDSQINTTVILRTNNLDAGFFNDPNLQYYLIPSTLNAVTKEIQGHQHITVQKLDDIINAPDPRKFAFFKGVNDIEINAQQNILQTIIPAGTIKENGIYRICSISGSAGHQSAVSPIQARGSSDDCIRITFTNSSKKIADVVLDTNVASKTTAAVVVSKSTAVNIQSLVGYETKKTNDSNFDGSQTQTLTADSAKAIEVLEISTKTEELQMQTASTEILTAPSTVIETQITIVTDQAEATTGTLVSVINAVTPIAASETAAKAPEVLESATKTEELQVQTASTEILTAPSTVIETQITIATDQAKATTGTLVSVINAVTTIAASETAAKAIEVLESATKTEELQVQTASTEILTAPSTVIETQITIATDQAKATTGTLVSVINAVTTIAASETVALNMFNSKMNTLLE
jgi:hypothetical protein